MDTTVLETALSEKVMFNLPDDLNENTGRYFRLINYEQRQCHIN